MDEALPSSLRLADSTLFSQSFSCSLLARYAGGGSERVPLGAVSRSSNRSSMNEKTLSLVTVSAQGISIGERSEEDSFSFWLQCEGSSSSHDSFETSTIVSFDEAHQIYTCV